MILMTIQLIGCSQGDSQAHIGTVVENMEVGDDNKTITPAVGGVRTN
jgi:hypothetical protein